MTEGTEGTEGNAGPQPERTGDDTRRSGRGRGGRGGRGGPRGGRRLEMLRRRLDLTDEQVTTLREKLAEHRKQKLAIVRDVLDDEQRARFDKHVERRRAHGPHHRHHRQDTPTDAA